MGSKKEELESLQLETIEKEKISLAIYSGLAAFSMACLLRVITLSNESWVVIAASCLFVVSAISFSSIVLSKYHVLNMTKDLHIGHVIVSEDSAKQHRLIGGLCLIVGSLLLLLYISWLTCAVGVVGIVLATKHHLRFKNKFDSMVGAREAVKRGDIA